jgi:hypothetical protein
MQSNDCQNTNIRRNMTTEQEKQDVWKLAKFLQRFKASSVRTKVFTQQPNATSCFYQNYWKQNISYFFCTNSCKMCVFLIHCKRRKSMKEIAVNFERLVMGKYFI